MTSVQLAMAMRVVLLLALLAQLWMLSRYRLKKRFKDERIRNRWDYLDRNPVEIAFLLAILATCAALVPVLLIWLASLAP